MTQCALRHAMLKYCQSTSIAHVKRFTDSHSTLLCRPFAPWEGCCVCWADEDRARILLCDSCDGEYHLYCLDPPLSEAPPGTVIVNLLHRILLVRAEYLHTTINPEPLRAGLEVAQRGGGASSLSSMTFDIKLCAMLSKAPGKRKSPQADMISQCSLGVVTSASREAYLLISVACLQLMRSIPAGLCILLASVA